MLTPRQCEIAACVAKGMSNKAIARETGLAVDTVNAHLQNIASRLPGAGTPRIKAVIFFLTVHEVPRQDSA